MNIERVLRRVWRDKKKIWAGSFYGTSIAYVEHSPIHYGRKHLNTEIKNTIPIPHRNKIETKYGMEKDIPLNGGWSGMDCKTFILSVSTFQQEYLWASKLTEGIT